MKTIIVIFPKTRQVYKLTNKQFNELKKLSGITTPLGRRIFSYSEGDFLNFLGAKPLPEKKVIEMERKNEPIEIVSFNELAEFRQHAV